MPNSPKEQEIAIINNMQSKTGKTIAGWIDILKNSGLQSSKDQLNWLKTEHKLGHFQANIIVKRAESGGKSDYDDIKSLVDNQFTNENKPLKDIYHEIAAVVVKFGKDIKIKPCKTYIPFYRNNQFLVLKAKKGFLYLGLPLPLDIKHEKLTGVKGLGMPEKINFALPIKSKDELTDDIIDLIKTTYNDN